MGQVWGTGVALSPGPFKALPTSGPTYSLSPPRLAEELQQLQRSQEAHPK